MDWGMVSICLHEVIHKTCPNPHSLTLQPRRWAAWVIRPPPAEDPLTQTPEWHQAEHKPAKFTSHFMHLNTPSTVKDYSHHISIIVGGTWSQGQVNTLCLAARERHYLCGRDIKRIWSVFTSKKKIKVSHLDGIITESQLFFCQPWTVESVESF